MVDDRSDFIAGRARTFVERVFATEVEELDCEGMLDVIARYVEVEISGEEALAVASGAPLHMRQCDECAELYATLALLVTLEEAGELPTLDNLWSDLRARVGDAARADGARPNATPAARPNPTRAAEPASGPSASYLFPFLPQPAVGRLAAVLALVAIVLAAGWWRAASTSTRAATEIERLERAMHTLAEADTVRSGNGAGGAWAKVFFTPAERDAVVYVGGFPQLRDGERLTCWLTAGSARTLAGTWDSLTTDLDWWTIAADRSLAEYDGLGMTIEPAGQPVVSIPLQDTR
jgi:hypothetical protein